MLGAMRFEESWAADTVPGHSNEQGPVVAEVCWQNNEYRAFGESQATVLILQDGA